MCKEIYEFCMEGRCENKIELLGDTQEEMNTDRQREEGGGGNVSCDFEK